MGKIILSRKGFDSGSGGGPSPVLPDGTMLSIPIPEPGGRRWGGIGYGEIAAGRWGTVGDVARQLGVSETVLARGGHLDPDLDPAARPRPAGWQPAFGQAGAAAAHLHNQGVGAGDLFVFWGLFRHTVQAGGTLRFDGPPFHAVFGWLRVIDVLSPGADDMPSWAAEHPHVAAPLRRNNTLYTGDGGTCTWSPHRQLSQPGGPVTAWTLPAALAPERCGHALSYHSDPARWNVAGDIVELRAVARGQEFVAEACEPWRRWADEMIC